MVVWCTQNMHSDGSTFMWHQPCNNQVALWIVRTHYEKAIVTHSKLYAMSTVSLLEQRIALYKSDQYASGCNFLWHLDLKIWLLFCHDIVNKVNQTSDCILLTMVL